LEATDNFLCSLLDDLVCEFEGKSVREEDLDTSSVTDDNYAQTFGFLATPFTSALRDDRKGEQSGMLRSMKTLENMVEKLVIFPYIRDECLPHKPSGSIHRSSTNTAVH
jgi:hypothetical protein